MAYNAQYPHSPYPGASPYGSLPIPSSIALICMLPHHESLVCTVPKHVTIGDAIRQIKMKADKYYPTMLPTASKLRLQVVYGKDKHNVFTDDLVGDIFNVHQTRCALSVDGQHAGERAKNAAAKKRKEAPESKRDASTPAPSSPAK